MLLAPTNLEVWVRDTVPVVLLLGTDMGVRVRTMRMDMKVTMNMPKDPGLRIAMRENFTK